MTDALTVAWRLAVEHPAREFPNDFEAVLQKGLDFILKEDK